AEQLERAVLDDLARPPATSAVAADRPIAFFCAEYGVHVSLPIYAGGLGALAGDIVKEASDLALPFVAVGLMYRHGYFRQRVDHSGWQQEYWVPTDPERSPAVLVTVGEERAPLRIRVPIDDHVVVAQVWRVDVGRVPLYLLDTDVPENGRVARWITERLYDSDPGTRLAQYVLLGAGGAAALRALGIEPAVVHMNEGHAGFAALEMTRSASEARVGLEAAFEAVRRRTVFTTHTPVPAGNDTYPPDQVRQALGSLARSLDADADQILRLGRTHPDDEHEPFGVTQFALRASRAANGVSRRHGDVSREMWRVLWPDRAIEDVPIGHVTNGVHVPSWVGAPMRRLLDRHLGAGWALRAADPATFEAIDAIPAHELWDVRCEQRRLLVDYVRDRSQLQRIARGDPRDWVEAAARTFDGEVLTLGFARRLATYKRLHLLLHDVQRSFGLLAGDRPVQLLLAGKAHPRDDDGKRLVQQLFGVRYQQRAYERIVFLEDYDLGVAARLVRGCDVWINLPRPPLEASGTSGMKSVMNGGLQLSVLDGWWAEAYDGSNGWALRAEEPGLFDAIDDIPDAELWAVRNEQRRLLASFIRERSISDRVTRGDTREYAESAAQAFDPELLTIGFARRLATYKRLSLLLHDVERAIRVLGGDRPIQLLLAGKAHPKDDEGKRLVQNLFSVRGDDRFSGRVVFLEDYDLAVGARLTRGCDVWLNVPRPPLEASGTSGMKSVVNGGLQLSVLDGWWSEGYDGENGWALSGEEDADHGAQDSRHADDLYRLLEHEVLREYWDRDGSGVPQAWVA
ncbi:MAG: alpha-glucan family phosphorylase, partial [Actinomycetota bacterium]|nr:alpha-glucan family phosphorylase [Actinomycetota bacterium]